MHDVLIHFAVQFWPIYVLLFTLKTAKMDSEKKVTTETTTTDHSGDGATHTQKTITIEKVEPKPEPKVIEITTVTEHRETTTED